MTRSVCSLAIFAHPSLTLDHMTHLSLTVLHDPPQPHFGLHDPPQPHCGSQDPPPPHFGSHDPSQPRFGLHDPPQPRFGLHDPPQPYFGSRDPPWPSSLALVHAEWLSILALLVWIVHFIVLRGKFWSPYLAKAQHAATRAALPIPLSVCSVFMCPKQWYGCQRLGDF